MASGLKELIRDGFVGDRAGKLKRTDEEAENGLGPGFVPIRKKRSDMQRDALKFRGKDGTSVAGLPGDLAARAAAAHPWARFSRCVGRR